MDEEMLNLVRGLLLDHRTEMNTELRAERERTERLGTKVRELEAKTVELETEIVGIGKIADKVKSTPDSNRAMIVQEGRRAALG